MFEKLPSNSKQLLDDILQADNPSEFLHKYYVDAQSKEKDVVRGIIRELIEKRFIDVKWADNAPYYVTIHNSARTYEEILKERETEMAKTQMVEKETSKIFISHRSTDKAVADAIFDFFVATGIPREKIFCSSLPGNDVKQKISVEVRNTMKNSCVNIAILSNEYYNSAYCLNEAGIIWFQDVPAIPIALPEIEPTSMIGFLDSDYKIRRLDNADDIAYIYDVVCEAVHSEQAKASVVTAESRKLEDKYNAIISNRTVIKQQNTPSSLSEITTDDEKIVIYYMLTKKVCSFSKSDIRLWLMENELYDVNINNAFELLSTIGKGRVEKDTLTIDIDFFRNHTVDTEKITEILNPVVKSHQHLSSIRFIGMWNDGLFNDEDKLFIAYIIKNRVTKFGTAWMEEGQVKAIRQWESDNNIDSSLSSKYSSCLNLFVEKDLVYESDWTKYGNPREYTLCESIKNVFLGADFPYCDEINDIMKEHEIELPF